jgi:hypothetical protein
MWTHRRTDGRVWTDERTDSVWTDGSMEPWNAEACVDALERVSHKDAYRSSYYENAKRWWQTPQKEYEQWMTLKLKEFSGHASDDEKSTMAYLKKQILHWFDQLRKDQEGPSGTGLMPWIKWGAVGETKSDHVKAHMFMLSASGLFDTEPEDEQFQELATQLRSQASSVTRPYGLPEGVTFRTTFSVGLNIRESSLFHNMYRKFIHVAITQKPDLKDDSSVDVEYAFSIARFNLHDAEIDSSISMKDIDEDKKRLIHYNVMIPERFSVLKNTATDVPDLRLKRLLDQHGLMVHNSSICTREDKHYLNMENHGVIYKSLMKRSVRAFEHSFETLKNNLRRVNNSSSESSAPEEILLGVKDLYLRTFPNVSYDLGIEMHNRLCDLLQIKRNTEVPPAANWLDALFPPKRGKIAFMIGILLLIAVSDICTSTNISFEDFCALFHEPVLQNMNDIVQKGQTTSRWFVLPSGEGIAYSDDNPMFTLASPYHVMRVPFGPYPNHVFLSPKSSSPSSVGSEEASSSPTSDGSPSQPDIVDIFDSFTLQSYGVLGLSSTGRKFDENEPNSTIAITDPAGNQFIQNGPRNAGGASESIYEWLGIQDDESFSDDVRKIITLRAQYHEYTRKDGSIGHCIHVVGPDFRTIPQLSRIVVVDLLKHCYKNVLNEFAKCPETVTTLRLLPISSGIFSGTNKNEMPKITYKALKRACADLSTETADKIRGRRFEMCIFEAGELEHFKTAGFKTS